MKTLLRNLIDYSIGIYYMTQKCILSRFHSTLTDSSARNLNVILERLRLGSGEEFVQVSFFVLCFLSYFCLILVSAGMFLADSTVFLACALSLAAFNITKVVRDGVVIEPVCEYKTGFIRYGDQTLRMHIHP